MKIDPNGPAFPISWDNYAPEHDLSGLTIRAWMATHMMAAMAVDERDVLQIDAALAVARADALIAELNKEPTHESH